MQRTFIFFLSVLACFALTASTASASPDKRADPPSKFSNSSKAIDLVIALDTSNSMDGLINSARQKLWDIVNDLATAKPTPRLRVGIVSFGNDGYSPETGWTRIDMNLSDDLDSVYEKLMGLRTHGGTEYVGRAVYVARQNMNWTTEKGALRMVFVAGNESADQDPTHRVFAETDKSRNNGIIVNTIFCGDETSRDVYSWRQVSQQSKGQFAIIDQRSDVVSSVETPVDRKMIELNRQLNETYIPYGRRGASASARQTKSDKSATGLSVSAGATRAAAKSTALYNNKSWDLVDALEDDADALKNIEDEELPAEVRALDKKKRAAYIRQQAAKRKRIQAQIQTLAKQRENYIAKEEKKREAEARRRGKPAPRKGLKKAMKKTIRSQAEAAGFAF